MIASMLLRAIVLVLVTSAVQAPLAKADNAPAFVLPDRFGRPAIVDGVDVTYAVIEGDWGLYRPGHGRVVVYDAAPALYPRSQGYFPAMGHRPTRGRLEIEPRRAGAQIRPAEPYFRAWSTQSGSAPASMAPTGDPPQVIVAPRFDERKYRRSRRAR
jgi:hypothetical protein